jgi:Flp pilus assembly protein TadG
MIPAAFRNFTQDRGGAVAVMFGLLAVPLVFAVGMSIDYGTAARLDSKLNSAADAAVLAAITPLMMSQSTATATQAAKNMFNAEVVGLPRLIYDPSTLSVQVTPNGLSRDVTVSYQAQSQNLFGGILNRNTIAFSGSSSGSAGTPPNIDFYLLLDSSPSMAIAGTPTDIATMVAHTTSQGGCAFACHQANPAADSLGNPGGVDNYALARSLGVTLRADLLDQAISNLTTIASNAALNSPSPVKPVYRMSISSFDTAFNQLVPLTLDYVSAWQTQLSAMQANNTQTLMMYSNNNGCAATSSTSHGVTTVNPCGAGVSNNDAATNYDVAMSGITALMPTPGGGTALPTDTPQEILFFVTDGVEDEMVGGGRQESTMTGTKDWCTPLKNKGIRIAILYTEYFPLPTNSWYVQHIQSFQPSIGTTLQNCASSGLFYEVGLGQDISTALAKLFAAATGLPHLTQ